MTTVSINPERLLGDLYELRKIGAYKTGVHRPTLSADDMISRHWLADKLRQIGHDATIDGIANVFGRSPAPGRKLLAGSHIESQNYSGWLDGALGVIYALEAARAVRETPGLEAHGIDVIAFADEEGHFGNFFGSYSFVGELSVTSRLSGHRWPAPCLEPLFTSVRGWSRCRCPSRGRG